MFKTNKQIEQVLYALDAQLKEEGIDQVEIVVCGAAALFNLLWHIEGRTTTDVDILGFVEKDKNSPPRLEIGSPVGAKITSAAKRVARDFGLIENWLNRGPAFLIEQGLPEGLLERVNTEKYGDVLIVHFVGRPDMINLKFYAYVEGSGRPEVHYHDLIHLKVKGPEIETAARWCIKIHPTDYFKNRVINGIKTLGFNEIAKRF